MYFIKKGKKVKSDKYSISNFGRVRNNELNYILKPFKIGNKRGQYYAIDFSINNKIYKNIKIHRLVTYAFLGVPLIKKQVNHKDVNKLNNRVTNLEWCNQSENILHAMDNGLNRNREFDLSLIKNICELIEHGYTKSKVICVMLNIIHSKRHRTLISDLKRNVRYKFISDDFKFTKYKDEKKYRIQLINDICEILEDNVNNKITCRNICEILNISYNRSMYDLISRIRRKEHYIDISINYNF